MPRNIVETLLGAVVLAVALGFLAWAYGRSDAGDPGGYTLRAKFDRVDGLDTGGDVRISGIKVGKVLAQELDPATYRAQVTFSVRNGIELPADSSAAVVSSGLLGGKYLSLVPGGDEQAAGRRRGDHADPVLGQSRGPDRPLHLQRPERPSAGSGRGGSGAVKVSRAVLRLGGLGLRRRMPGPTARCGRISWPFCRVWTRSRRGRPRCACRWASRSPIGTLRLTARACLTTPPTEPPESAVFLEIQRRRPRHARPRPQFTGWMFASSPSLSALEHPVYDVWLIECAEPLEPDPPPPLPPVDGAPSARRWTDNRPTGNAAGCARAGRRRRR